MTVSEDLLFAGAAEQARQLRAGAVTSPDLVEAYLGRIERFNPILNAYRVVLGDAARVQAADAQRRLDAGESTPLLGVPIAIKDDTDIAGEVTTYGSAGHGPPAEADSEMVRRLREAGAVFLGKTNVPEMMIWPFTETETYGETRNPWHLDYTPGGSSGGTGAAVAAGLAALAHGSDGAGSIRIPASWCGLFGIKPQRDRVPLAPLEDAWCGLSTYGPLSRTVADAGLFLDATADKSGFADAAAREPGRLRIALSTKVPTGLVARVDPLRKRAVAEAGDLLRSLGHKVIERDPNYPATGIAHVLARYFRGIHDDCEAMARPDQLERRSKQMSRVGGMISDSRMAAVRAGEAKLMAAVGEIFDDVDVVITPGTATGPSRIGQYRGKNAIWTLQRVSARVPFQAVFNATGQPAAVVPWGRDDIGLPYSIQLVGRPHGESTLLSLAAQIESVRPWAGQRPPVHDR